VTRAAAVCRAAGRLRNENVDVERCYAACSGPCGACRFHPGSKLLRNYLRFRRLWQAIAARGRFNIVGSILTTLRKAAVDSASQLCTIGCPERSQMEVPMAIQAHLAELERKHEALENQLHDAMNHPSTDDITIIEIKRRKLQVKDEIERLRSVADGTVH
jgi:hypothetical protein